MVSDHEVKEKDTEQHCDHEVGRKDSSKGNIHDDSTLCSEETKTVNKLQGSECETQQPQTTNELYRRKTGSNQPTNTTVYTFGTPQRTGPDQQTTDLTPVKKYVSFVYLDVNIGDVNLHCPPTERLGLFLGIIVIFVVFVFIFATLLNMYVYNYNNMC